MEKQPRNKHQPSQESEGALAKNLTMIISVASFIISSILGIYTFYQDYLSHGKLIIHAPTEACIVRGIQVFPSDHIVLSLYLENTGSTAKTLERPTLYFTYPKDEPHRYGLVGIYSQIDLDEFDQWYEITRGITLPGKSLERYVLVFAPEYWWDESGGDFNYHFVFDSAAEIDNVDMELVYYQPDRTGESILWEEQDSKVFLSLPLYSALNGLVLRPSIVEHLLQQPEIINNSELHQALESAPVGNSNNADCYPLRSLPPHPN